MKDVLLRHRDNEPFSGLVSAIVKSKAFHVYLLPLKFEHTSLHSESL